jgi:hypothetical protein
MSTASKKKDVTNISKVIKTTKTIKKVRAAKLCNFVTLEQLSEITESYAANRQPHEQMRGEFHLAAVDAKIPTGSLEIFLKVLSGTKWPKLHTQFDVCLDPKLITKTRSRGRCS